MSDEGYLLEWHECRVCDEAYTWFSIEVIRGVELYGWVHKDGKGDEKDCPLDRGMFLKDLRDMG